MKNLFFVFTVLLFGVFACDKVDMPVEDPGPTVTDTSGVDTQTRMVLFPSQPLIQRCYILHQERYW